MSATDGSGLRIAFIGTCQVTGMAAAARSMLPGAEVIKVLIGPNPDPVAMRAKVAGVDVAVTQVPSDHGGLLSIEGLAADVGTAIFSPPAVFTGFHPDMTYINGPEGMVRAAHGPYHSQIAVAAFTLRLNVEQTVRLYNAHVFHRLGYLESYAAARVRVTAIFERAGFPMARALQEWRRERTIFMHTINHPTIALNWRMAAFALDKAGLVDSFTPLDPTVPDDLEQSIVLPVLPAIARRIGVVGGETILRGLSEVGGDPRELSRTEFVRRSFAVYEAMDPAVFAMPSQVALAERLRAVLA